MKGGNSHSRARVIDDVKPVASQRHWDFRYFKSLRRVLRVDGLYVGEGLIEVSSLCL